MKKYPKHDILSKEHRKFVIYRGAGGRAEFLQSYGPLLKVSKGAKIRNRYNQVPHLTQDTNGKVTNSQLDTANERQVVRAFPAGENQANLAINLTFS